MIGGLSARLMAVAAIASMGAMGEALGGPRLNAGRDKSPSPQSEYEANEMLAKAQAKRDRKAAKRAQQLLKGNSK